VKASGKQVGGDHYARFAIQPSEFIHKNRLGFLEGNVIKYVCRHGAKHGRQDLLKARHYIDLLLEWEYGNVQGIDGEPGGLALDEDSDTARHVRSEG